MIVLLNPHNSPMKVSTIIIPILQMRKLRQKEVKSLAQSLACRVGERVGVEMPARRINGGVLLMDQSSKILILKV